MKYFTSESKYCYPGTDILINKLNIHEESLLEEAEKLFTQLKEENFIEGKNVDNFSNRAGYYMAELNALHPFREGNGRTIREFIRCLAHHNNYTLKWGVLNKDELLAASIKSMVNTEHLASCIRKAISLERLEG